MVQTGGGKERREHELALNQLHRGKGVWSCVERVAGLGDFGNGDGWWY